MSDSVVIIRYVELLCTDLFRILTLMLPHPSGGLRRRERTSSGKERHCAVWFRVCLPFGSLGLLYKYVRWQGAAPLRPRSRPAAALYTLDAALTVTAKLSELPEWRRYTLGGLHAGNRAALRRERILHRRSLRSRHDHRLARRRCDPGGCAASVEKRRLAPSGMRAPDKWRLRSMIHL